MAFKTNRKKPEVATDHICEYLYRERLLNSVESFKTCRQGCMCLSHGTAVQRSSDDDYCTPRVCNFQSHIAKKAAENCTPDTRIFRSQKMHSSHQISTTSVLHQFALQAYALCLQAHRGFTLAVAQLIQQTEFGM